METGELILLGLVVGGGAWLLLRKPSGPTAPVAAPCTISGSYAGVGLGLPCSVVSGAAQAVGSGLTAATRAITGGGSSLTLQQQVDYANKIGRVYSPDRTWAGSTQTLPTGYKNYVSADGKSTYIGPADASARIMGTAVQPR